MGHGYICRSHPHLSFVIYRTLNCYTQKTNSCTTSDAYLETFNGHTTLTSNLLFGRCAIPLFTFVILSDGRTNVFEKNKKYL